MQLCSRPSRFLQRRRHCIARLFPTAAPPLPPVVCHFSNAAAALITPTNLSIPRHFSHPLGRLRRQQPTACHCDARRARGRLCDRAAGGSRCGTGDAPPAHVASCSAASHNTRCRACQRTCSSRRRAYTPSPSPRGPQPARAGLPSPSRRLYATQQPQQHTHTQQPQEHTHTQQPQAHTHTQQPQEHALMPRSQLQVTCIAPLEFAYKSSLDVACAPRA